VNRGCRRNSRVSQPWGQRIEVVGQSKRGGVFVCDMERQREAVGEMNGGDGGGERRGRVGQGHRLVIMEGCRGSCGMR
jgi:hypothetical protein